MIYSVYSSFIALLLPQCGALSNHNSDLPNAAPFILFQLSERWLVGVLTVHTPSINPKEYHDICWLCSLLFSDSFAGAEQIIAPTLNVCCTVCRRDSVGPNVHA